MKQALLITVFGVLSGPVQAEFFIGGGIGNTNSDTDLELEYVDFDQTNSSTINPANVLV